MLCGAPVRRVTGRPMRVERVPRPQVAGTRSSLRPCARGGEQAASFALVFIHRSILSLPLPLSTSRRLRSALTSFATAASTGKEGPTSIGSQWPPKTHTSFPRLSSSAMPSLSRVFLICGSVSAFHRSACAAAASQAGGHAEDMFSRTRRRTRWRRGHPDRPARARRANTRSRPAAR